jgi:small subunit ribosomal protein S13
VPRLIGVDIPNEKKVYISLTYIYGVGPHIAKEICSTTGIDPEKRAKDLTEEEIGRIATLLGKQYLVEGALRRQIEQNITRLKKIQCYRGIRHIRGLPVRGQRTQTNARTRKGRRKTVAGKKSVKQMR